MKKLLFVAAAIVAIVSVNNGVMASPATDDLIRMARSGVDEEVLAAYVESSPDTYDLSADDIITLKDLGVPSKIIASAMHHGRNIDTETASLPAGQSSSIPVDTIKNPLPPEQLISTSAAEVPPQGDLNISYFYQALYPYGNWIDVDGAWCWQPSAAVMSGDWEPYCSHGHWVWSDWGWAWDSDYSWGWAPFHYGRWLRDRRHGWCWVPDNEWGPAWVSWRSGGDFCGWAPLPPRTRYDHGFYFGVSRVNDDFEFNLTEDDYFFVPTGYFCDPHPWVHRVPRERRGEAFRRTEHIRNPYGFENDHFFNRGPAVDEMAKISHRSIEPVRIAHDDLKPGDPIRRGTIKDNRLLLYKPAIAPTAPRNPEAVRAQLEIRERGAKLKIGIDGAHLKLEMNAAQQTMKGQRMKAQNAEKEKIHLEKAAGYEQDAKKRDELRAEADIQSMNARQAQSHVQNIQRWKPEEQKPAVMPQSRVVPRPSEENRRLVEMQVRSQIHNEAQIEQERQQAAEEMVRNREWQKPGAPAPAPQKNSAPSPQQRRGGRER